MWPPVEDGNAIAFSSTLASSLTSQPGIHGSKSVWSYPHWPSHSNFPAFHQAKFPLTSRPTKTMKAVILSALAVAGAIGLASTTECDLTAIKTTLMANESIAVELSTAVDKCKNDTGVDIFAITQFPTKETALKFQLSNDGCNVAFNIVTRQANINTRCTLVVNDTMVIYGDLVSDFLTGKTGNESESDSGSIEIPSDSASGSESESASGSSSTASSKSASTSDAATTALSFVSLAFSSVCPNIQLGSVFTTHTSS